MWESTHHRAQTLLGRLQSMVTHARTDGCTQEEDKPSVERQLLCELT